MSVLLRPDEREAIERLVRTVRENALRQRARLLLLVDDGRPTREVAREVGLSESTVRRWRRLFFERRLGVFPADELAAPTEESPAEEDALKRTLRDPALYVNRELSLLAFQERVFEEARDPANPLLERVKFLSIVGSNLDEFFMVRVGGLKKQLAAGVTDTSPDGLTPGEQLVAVRRVAQRLMEEAQACLQETLIPALAREGVFVYDYADLDARQRERVRAYFEEVVFPVLTPMAFDPGHPFPHISNLSLNLAVLIRDEEGNERFARLKVPDSLPRLLPVDAPAGGGRSPDAARRPSGFVWIEQVVAASLDTLFPGLEVLAAHPFHVTRNADMVIQELEADDLLETMEQGLRQRRFGAVVRLTTNPAMPETLRRSLRENLRAVADDDYVLPGPLGLRDLMGLYRQVDRYDLRDPAHVPVVPAALKRELREGSFFDAVRKRPFLLHHPYDSFNPVVDFLEQAAEDPDVLAIKQTLYRVGRDAPVVHALLKARENDKQVTALVELKARFDEESNIGWARMLEQEGVHVVYGLLGLKTHSKIALVVRQEEGRIRRYLHLATGNYNTVTAHLYEDLGYFTTDEAIGADATDLFNYLTGYSAKHDYRKLLVAPINLRARMEELIRREIRHADEGRAAHLILKTNALVDTHLIRLLYRASQAGVEVDLIVRGICCLRPGLPGLSDRIRVRSILGRFLEHSRIYYFLNGGEEEVYLGSADLMPRNLDRRVEVLFPVAEPDQVRHLRDEILETYLRDDVKARLMQPDGSYVRPEPDDDGPRVEAQRRFVEGRARQTEATRYWSIF